jgi:MFS family permease
VREHQAGNAAPGDALFSRGSHFTPYLATGLIARAATEAASPAVLLTAIAILGKASTGSYLVAALTVAAALTGPLAGALIDRSPHPRASFTLGMSLLAGGLLALVLTIGHAPVIVLMAFAFIAGLGFPAVTGAWSAQMPTMVSPANLHRGYSIDAGTYSIAAIIGPPAAAAMLYISDRAPMWLPVTLLAVSIVMLRFVPLKPAVHDHEGERPTLLEDLRHGIETILHRASLRRSTFITTLGFAGQAALFISAPLLSQQLTDSLTFTGVILGFNAAGGVTAALVITRVPIRRPDLLVIITMAISMLALLLVAVAPVLWVVLLGAFIMGATDAPMLSAMYLVRNRESSARVRAQVFSTAASLRTAAFGLAAALFGTLLAHGTTFVLLVGVAMHAVALIIGLAIGPPLAWHRLRRLAS